MQLRELGGGEESRENRRRSSGDTILKGAIMWYKLLICCLSLQTVLFAKPVHQRPVHPRPVLSSAPYLSGDTFRSFCTFHFDEVSSSFNPAKVKKGSRIFVKTDMLEAFFKEKHALIKHPYILISHNADHPAPGPFSKYLEDKKIIAWFAQNVDTVHPKLHPIPIGIANRVWPHGSIDLLTKCRKKIGKTKRTHWLYMNFVIGTNKDERSRVYKKFIKKPYCVARRGLQQKNYLEDLATVRFVLSPRGNGLDCHRTWEALYMGAIPIVKTSPMDSLFRKMPVIIVKNWDVVNLAFLKKQYARIQRKKYSCKKLFAGYWKAEIASMANNSHEK